MHSLHVRVHLGFTRPAAVRTQLEQSCNRVCKDWVQNMSAEARNLVLAARLHHMQAACDVYAATFDWAWSTFSGYESSAFMQLGEALLLPICMMHHTTNTACLFEFRLRGCSTSGPYSLPLAGSFSAFLSVASITACLLATMN